MTRSFCTWLCSCLMTHSSVNTHFGDFAGEDSFGQSTDSIFFGHVFRDRSKERHHGDFGGDLGGAVQSVRGASTDH
jgi:hypothetical protein